MEILGFAQVERNESAVDEYQRRRNRIRRDDLKEIIRQDGCAWVYPFVDQRYVAKLVSVVVANRTGHLIGTIYSEFGKFKIVLDSLRTLETSDFADFSATEGDQINPYQEYMESWKKYFKSF